jgi:hypothetical protein
MGILYFQFCDIKNLAKIFAEIAKLVEFTLEIEKNPKHSQFSWPEKKTLTATKRTVESSKVFLVNNVI